MGSLDFLPTVDKCFCLLELPIGSLIIGIVELLMPLFFFGYHNYGSCYGDCGADWAYYVWVALVVCYILSAIFVIVVFLVPKQKQLLLAAVIIQLILIVIFLVMTIIAFIKAITNEMLQDGVIGLIVGLLILALFAYFVIVLHSWYKTL